MTGRQPPGSPSAPFPGGVVIIGTGLIGTSVGLALRDHGVRVWLADGDPAAAAMAAHLGAGDLLGSGASADLSPFGSHSDAVAGVTPVPPAAAGSAADVSAPSRGSADLAVLAVPPDAVAPMLAAAQKAGLARCYTDVASVKARPLAEAAALGCDLTNYVPGHPLAGRERSGPAAARADLFLGRPWALCPQPQTAGGAVSAVTALVRTCGAEPIITAAAEHDRWVALVSHAPHVVASAMAARLTAAPGGALTLAGQGLRDVTRIAAGDAGLWTQILMSNAPGVSEVLLQVAADLHAAATALANSANPADPAGSEPLDGGLTGPSAETVGLSRGPGAPSAGAAGLRPGPGVPSAALADSSQALTGASAGPAGSSAEMWPAPAGQGGPDDAAARLTRLLEDGRSGVARIPGKHSGPAASYAVVQVVIPDQPGELARLFQAAGEAGINIEDIGIEHAQGLPSGVAELSVRPEAAADLAAALAARGWPAYAPQPGARQPPQPGA